MLRIGTARAEPGLLLAPMEDITDLPFRVICRELGAEMVYTEFINAEGLVRSSERTFDKLKFLEVERPLGIQIYGASELSMERAAEIAAAMQPDLIDINCGCWVKNVALRGAGAGLLRDLPRMREVVARVVGATTLPVTVKTRLGWDQDSIRIVEVARMLEQIGVQALTVHCRTRAQGHKGDVDYTWIPRIMEAVSIPVILNGDITTPEEVAGAFAETGCDGVKVGRGAIQHPWLFREARRYLESGSATPAPDLAERASLCLRHLHLALLHRGERYGLIGLRRFYAGYFRGMPGAARLRADFAGYKEAATVEDRLLSMGAVADPGLPALRVAGKAAAA